MLNVSLINCDVGQPCFGVRHKCGAEGALLGLFGGFLSGAQQHTYTQAQQRLQSKLNREEMAHSMALQQSNQEWLMNRQYGAAVSGMKNAGLNPATANGTTPATPALAHPSSGGSGPSAGMVDLAGAALVGEQVEAAYIQNERDRLKLETERQAFEYGNRHETYSVDPDTGERIDDVDKWADEHPGKLPETRVVSHKLGADQQRQVENEWNAKDFERGARTAAAKLEAAINSGQLKDKDVMDAFVQLPANERKTLSKIWREYDDNHDLAEFQKDISKLQKQDIEASSFGSLVKNLQGPMSFAEKSLAVLGFIFNRLTSNTGLNFGFSRSHSNSKSRNFSTSHSVSESHVFKE